MISHVSINTSDYGRAKEFYTKALAPLGYTLIKEFAEWGVAGFGANGKADFWVHAGEFKQATHVAFAAKNKEEVQGFHAAALAAGGKDNGKPDYEKDYAPNYYASFAYDPDGNNIEAVFFE